MGLLKGLKGGIQKVGNSMKTKADEYAKAQRERKEWLREEDTAMRVAVHEERIKQAPAVARERIKEEMRTGRKTGGSSWGDRFAAQNFPGSGGVGDAIGTGGRSARPRQQPRREQTGHDDGYMSLMTGANSGGGGLNGLMMGGEPPQKTQIQKKKRKAKTKTKKRS